MPIFWKQSAPHEANTTRYTIPANTEGSASVVKFGVPSVAAPHAMPMRPATMNWIAESASASRPSERRADTAICKPRKKAEASMIASPIPKVSEASPAPENEMKPMPARASNAAAMF